VRREEVRDALPDYVLGSLSEIEMAAVRRHLRGCSACRADASTLDEGVAMFANAAHAAPPPPELKLRVMAVLSEEWAETPDLKVPFRQRLLRWPALAAAVVLLAGALAWGGVSQWRADAARQDAASYQQFLHALGGRDVRVGVLRPTTKTVVDGTAVMYDSDRGQSWALVLVKAPGYTGKIGVTLASRDGRTIRMFPVEIDANGEGSSWLVTASDLSSFSLVRLRAADGVLIATARAVGENH
jgi:Putative zinc-finger